MTDNQPASSDRLDEILAKYDGYTLDEYTGNNEFGHDYSNNSSAVETKAAIQQLLVAERIDELQRFCNFDGDYCVGNRIAALQSQLTKQQL